MVTSRAFSHCIVYADVRQVNRDTLEPIMFLLQSHDVEVQRAASAALGNLAVNSKWPMVFQDSLNDHISAENKLLIVKLGGLEPLIRQMGSPNVEVQCNAVGCITNLATHGEYQVPVVKHDYLWIAMIHRRQQSQDCKVRCAALTGGYGKKQRLARATQCHWCSLEHDSLM